MTLKTYIASLPILPLLLISLGCAVPGEPLPPLLEIPVPVSSLSAEQTGPQLRVKIPVPQLTTEGTRPRRMERIELYLEYTAPGAPQPDFASAPLKAWTAADISNGSAELSLTESLSAARLGQRAWLAVRVRNHRGIDAGLSNVVSVDVENLPEAPGGLAATVTEHTVELRWTSSSGSVFPDAGPPSPTLQYEVFRTPANAAAPLESIGRSSATSFADSAISLNSTYHYAVRAVMPSDHGVAATPLSAIIEVATTDRFAPAAPENLRAIAVTGSVELAWSPNSEADLAGYNVYREQLAEDGSSASRVKLNPAPVDIPLFRDASAQAASRYRYVVTALDRDGNESRPSNEESVETE